MTWRKLGNTPTGLAS